VVSLQVSLTPFSQVHARDPNYCAWLNDSHILRYLGRPTYHGGVTPKICEDYFKEVAEDENITFFAVLLNDREFIGTAKLRKIPTAGSHTGVADAGLMIGSRRYWGLGIGSKVVSLLSEVAFQTLGLRKLVGGMYAGNLACVKAFLNSGFHEEGRLLAHLWDPQLERFDDLVLMGLLKKDFVAFQSSLPTR